MVHRFLKKASVLAEQCTEGGLIETPEGDMRYQAGDYLVTDSPPTHVWPVKREVFESTYSDMGDVVRPERAAYQMVVDARRITR